MAKKQIFSPCVGEFSVCNVHSSIVALGFEIEIDVFGFVWLGITIDVRFCPDLREKARGSQMRLEVLKIARMKYGISNQSKWSGSCATSFKFVLNYAIFLLFLSLFLWSTCLTNHISLVPILLWYARFFKNKITNCLFFWLFSLSYLNL